MHKHRLPFYTIFQCTNYYNSNFSSFYMGFETYMWWLYKFWRYRHKFWCCTFDCFLCSPTLYFITLFHGCQKFFMVVKNFPWWSKIFEKNLVKMIKNGKLVSIVSRLPLKNENFSCTFPIFQKMKINKNENKKN